MEKIDGTVPVINSSVLNVFKPKPIPYNDSVQKWIKEADGIDVFRMVRNIRDSLKPISKK